MEKITQTPVSKTKMVKVKTLIDERTFASTYEVTTKHPRYHKILTRFKKILVHIPVGKASPKLDEMVEVSASKPISKTKRWVLK